MSKLVTRGVASQELAVRDGQVTEGYNPDRITGTELALKRIRERRVGGVFVQDDVSLNSLEFMPKGDYPRSTEGERFVRSGRAEEIASQLAEIHGMSAEAQAEFDAANARESELKRKDEEEEAARIAKEEEAVRFLEEAKRLADEEAAAKSKKQRDDWEASMMARDGLFDREATEEDLALVKEMIADVGPRHEIPEELFAKCRFPSDVNELVELKKQFKDIDFDQSGFIDLHEMTLALRKMGMDPTEAQVKALLAEADDSDDAQVDFTEFLVLVDKFKSSNQERAHQQADRKGLTGLADVVKNIDLEAVTLVETEFGSKAVISKKVTREWEHFMEYGDPLHWAAGKGDLNAVQQFVMGLNDAPLIKPERINKDAKMPMHYAAAWNQAHILTFLLDQHPTGAGCGTDPVDFNFVTPLMMAAESGRAAAVDLLLENWANLLQRNRGGVTPFVLACKFNHIEVAKSLIKSGCIISGSDDEKVRMWSMRKAGVARDVETHGVKGPIFCMEVWMDQIATGHQDGVVRLSSITTQQKEPYAMKGFEKGPRRFEGHKGAILCLKMERSSTTTQGRHMVSGSEDATVRVWLVHSGECIQVMKDTRQGQLPSPVTAVDLSPRTDRVVSGTRHGLFYMWQMSSGEMLQHYAVHQGMCVNVLQLDGDCLLTASNDRSVRIWDLANNRFRLYSGHESLVNAAVRVDARRPRGGGEWLPEMIVSGSNIGELFTFVVDRRPSGDPIERRGYFASERKGYAFASPVNDVKVVTYGGVHLVVACSVPEGGVRVWNLEADDGSQPLHTFKGHADDIRCLGWYGVEVNQTDAAGTSPLMTAAELGLEDIVKMLLDCVGIDPWIGDRQSCETALHRAARHGHATCMRLLLEFDPSLICAGTADHSSALHLAVLHPERGPECVQVALEYGADVNQLNDAGYTAVHIAARHGRYKALRLLVAAPGVCLNRMDAQHPVGGTFALVRPSQAPPEHTYPNLVSASTQLVSTGFKWAKAEPKWKAGATMLKQEITDKFKLIRHPYGWAPLHEASAYGHTAAVKVLAEADTDINITDDMGRTPLHMACANGTPDLIAILAANGADPNVRDCHGCVAIQYAVKTAQDGALSKMLEVYEGGLIDLDTVDEVYGLSALHMAAKYGLDEMCFLLLEAGAEHNSSDPHMCTPLHYAVMGAVLGMADETPPEIAFPVFDAAFGMRDRRRAERWIQQWDDGEVLRRGMSNKRLGELREEVQGRYGRFFESAQVLLDGFSRYDTTDVSGKTARDYAQGHAEAWKTFEAMFKSTTPDGQAYLVKGDSVRARYVGESGTKYESPNLWEMLSRFGVMCLERTPMMSGSRAFKRFENRFAKQEVDWRALGDLEVGQAGDLDRKGSAVYELSHVFVEDATGNRSRAKSFLCNWQPRARTFETKYNALHVGLVPGNEYDLRVDFVEEWRAGMPGKYKRQT